MFERDIYPETVQGLEGEALGEIWPDRKTFLNLARQQRIVPVVIRLLADQDTPISLYRKLTAPSGPAGSFLLESAGQGEDSRWSIIGVNARASLTEKDGNARWFGVVPASVPTSGDPLEALRATAAEFKSARITHLPPFTGGLVGFVSYDAVRRFENLPHKPVDEIGTPELCMLLAQDVAVYDHRDIFQVVPSQRHTQATSADPLDVYRVLRRLNPSPYVFLVRAHDGDGKSIDVVGASPETLVTVRGRHASTHPIAGSRPRGANAEEDERIKSELLADPKDRSEHLMLVDLGRNDLQKVCEPGSVNVRDFMSVVKYSHIMHVISTVTGTLKEGLSAFDALAVTFPAGTLTGAPKPRAMQLIDELEPVSRGIYGGTVGYLDFAGDLDMAIAIRTAVMKDGRAHVQAGGGVVADSIPTMEHRESLSKAAAAQRAVASAETLRQQ
ncbi:chorismate-binding protein [Dermabacter hominis]|uniref:chorismate-binding protein n=1 Tax=Dermabacter hominis TaxID=36740 RepID=UPI0021A5766B|nr:chorismate-binding protein [Dermabacter hominis]MCT1716895.1 chorismate-binding protein [Dermabacter hominis]